MRLSSSRARPAVLLLTLCLSAAYAGTPATPAEMAAYAEKLMDEQKLSRDGPGVTLLVARGDQLLVETARGMASIELGVPLKPQQLMRIGSVTKQFAAATLLKLIDEGKASLDDPLSKFLPDYPNGAHITLLQLLNHTSGVKSYTGIPGYMAGPIRLDLDTATLIKQSKDLPVDFAPGASWAYNNSGYVLVGAVIEAISGKSWHQQMSDALLAPLKLTDIHYQDSEKLFKGMVQGYTTNDKRETAPADILSMTQPHAAGALIGNVEALWHWNQALHGGKILSAASYQRMITPEGAAKARGYGFGIEAGTLRGHPMLQHSGGIHGFNSQLSYLPESQVTVALLRNSDAGGLNLGLMARKLAAFAIGEPYPDRKPVDVSVAQLKASEGVYVQDKRSRELRVRDGVLYSQTSGGSSVAMIPLGGERYGATSSLAEMKIERGADGKVTGLLVFQDGEGAGEAWKRSGDLPAEKPSVELSAAQKQVLVGDYAAPEFSMKIFVGDKGELFAQGSGQPPLAVKAASPRLLWASRVDATLEFSAEEGAAKTLTLTQGQRKIVMQRK